MKSTLTALLLTLAACDTTVLYEGPACFDDAGNPQGAIMLITPVNAWPANFPVIDDGDTCGNAEHLATAQKFADAVTYLREGVEGKALSKRKTCHLWDFMNTSTRWTHQGLSGYWQQTSVASQGLLLFQLPIDGPARIQDIRMVIRGGAHGGSYPPATLPDITVYRNSYVLSSGDSVFTNLGATIDAPASQVAYELPHEVVVTINETVSNLALYNIQVRGEAGANSATGLKLLHVYATVVPIP